MFAAGTVRAFLYRVACHLRVSLCCAAFDEPHLGACQKTQRNTTTAVQHFYLFSHQLEIMADGAACFKQEERSPCGCTKSKEKQPEDMDIGSPIPRGESKDALSLQSHSQGKSFPSLPNSLTQFLNNLPTSNNSFDIPDVHSPTASGFISPTYGPARLGKKRPLSISPLSNSSINIDALVRGSPVSLVNFISQSRNSSAGSFGHLSPSLFQSVPSTHNQYNKPSISLSKAVHPSSYSKTMDGKGLFHRIDSVEEQDESEDHDSGMKLEFVDIPSDHDAAYLQPHLMLDQDPAFPEIDGHSELGQRTEYPLMNEFKPNQKSSSRVKRIYYAYPAVETPHNNKCMWQGCELQCESLEELVTHVNREHIYQDSRKDFVCQWDGCVRDGRAFKAQYMLLVHMRRHTGEKPHKCHVSEIV